MRSIRYYVAAVVASGVGMLAGSSAAQQHDTSQEASSAFATASKLFQKKKYTAAIVKFQRAYTLKPHYSVRCNIALCHERLGDYVTAAGEYGKCLAGATSKAKRASIRKTLKEVKSRIGTVKIRSKGGGEIFVDDSLVGNTPRTLRLNPGQRVVEVRRKGARSARTTIVLRGGEQLSVELEPTELAVDLDGGVETLGTSKPVEEREEDPPSKGISQAWFWTMAGATIALTATSIVLGLQTLELKSDFEGDPTQQSYDRGVDRRMATNIVLAVTAAAATSATVLFFYTDFGKRNDRGETGSTVVVGLRGAF